MNNELLTRLKQNKYLRYIAIILICYFTYVVYLWSNTQTTDNAYIEADITLVSAEISGVIQEVLIQENNEVVQGQIIAKIHDEDYQATFDKAKAAVEGAGEDIKISEQNIEIAGINLKKNNSALGSSKTNYELASVDYQRTIDLNKDKFASQKLLDNAKSKYAETKSLYNQALLELESMSKNLLLLHAEKASKEAKLESLIQDKIIAEHNLEDTKLRAPISGILANSGLRVGSYVRPGVVLYSVVPKNLYVKANFKETQIPKIKPGMSAILKFDSLPGRKITGTVRNFAPATGAKFSLLPQDNATGNFTKIVQRVPVTIDFDIPEGVTTLMPGISAVVSIATNQGIQ